MRLPLALTVSLLAAAAAPLHAQRAAPSRAAIDSFVVAVRDMAAWGVITPAAHLPVGGLLDSAGRVESVVGDGPSSRSTPTDSVLVAFREALARAARNGRHPGIAMAYLVRVTPPGRRRATDAVLVEVEHQSGFRTNVVWPYTLDEESRPVFGTSYESAGTLFGFAPARRSRRRG